MFLSIAKGIWLGTVGIFVLAVFLMLFGGLLTETTRRTLKRKLRSEYHFEPRKSYTRRFMDWLVKSALDAAGI